MALRGTSKLPDDRELVRLVALYGVRETAR